jgi:hypothetical protein
MKEFVLIFRSSGNPHANPSAAQMQERMNWMGGVAAQNKLADKGNRLSASRAKIVRPGNLVEDGPYTSAREFVNGYMIVKAATIDEAIAIAQTNPIIKAGGNIEVRAVLTPDDRD